MTDIPQAQPLSEPAELIARFLETSRRTVREVLPLIMKALEAPRREACTKRDGSLVTAIDHEVERTFLGAFGRALPATPIVAEEAEAERANTFQGNPRDFYAHAFQAPYFISIDPLDGTRNFVDGCREFCVAAAFVGRRGDGVWPLASLVAIPTEGIMMWTDGVGVYREEIESGQLSAFVRAETDSLKLSVSSADRRWLEAEHIKLVRPWVSSGSSVFDMTGTIGGRLAGSVIGAQRLWDVMAPLALAGHVGVTLRDLRSGEEVWSLTPEDLSADLAQRPWGLDRKFILAPAQRPASELIAFS